MPIALSPHAPRPRPATRTLNRVTIVTLMARSASCLPEALISLSSHAKLLLEARIQWRDAVTANSQQRPMIAASLAILGRLVFGENLQQTALAAQPARTSSRASSCQRLNSPSSRARVDSMERGLDRGDILVHFAESPENVARTEPDLTNGVWVL